MSGPEGASIRIAVWGLGRMKPGVSSPSVYWPTIWPRSLIPKAVAAEPPSGMNVCTLPFEREKAFPLPSLPTTVPNRLTPKAMAVVDPLMFSSWTFGDRSGLTVKLWRFPLLSMSNPTTLPELEIPFSLLPAAAVPRTVMFAESSERSSRISTLKTQSERLRVDFMRRSSKERYDEEERPADAAPERREL